MDFIVGTLSMTAERMRRVDFVHPGFYSGGVALYVMPVSPMLHARQCALLSKWSAATAVMSTARGVHGSVTRPAACRSDIT